MTLSTHIAHTHAASLEGAWDSAQGAFSGCLEGTWLEVKQQFEDQPLTSDRVLGKCSRFPPSRGTSLNPVLCCLLVVPNEIHTHTRDNLLTDHFELASSSFLSPIPSPCSCFPGLPLKLRICASILDSGSVPGEPKPRQSFFPPHIHILPKSY